MLCLVRNMPKRPARDSEPRRADVLRFAAEAQLDPRTALRVILLGTEALRAKADRERADDAASRLGLQLGCAR